MTIADNPNKETIEAANKILAKSGHLRIGIYAGQPTYMRRHGSGPKRWTTIDRASKGITCPLQLARDCCGDFWIHSGSTPEAARIVQQVLEHAPIVDELLRSATKIISETVYGELKANGCKLDNHQSDLYVLDTPEAREIITRHDFIIKPFLSDSDPREMWLELLFQYQPYWDDKQPS